MRPIPIAQLTFQEFANAGCSVSQAVAISPQNNGFPSGFYYIADEDEHRLDGQRLLEEVAKVAGDD